MGGGLIMDLWAGRWRRSRGADAGSGVATSVRVSLLAGPNCDVLLGWDPRAVPADWQRARARYFRLNWLRLRAWLTWLACGLCLAVTLLELAA